MTVVIARLGESMGHVTTIPQVSQAKRLVFMMCQVDNLDALMETASTTTHLVVRLVALMVNVSTAPEVLKWVELMASGFVTSLAVK
jgi:hypothetical protein